MCLLLCTKVKEVGKHWSAFWPHERVVSKELKTRSLYERAGNLQTRLLDYQIVFLDTEITKNQDRSSIGERE